MKYVLIIGAKNELGIELANLYARNNYNLYLAGRSIKDLQDKSDEIEKKYKVKSVLCELDVTDYNSHQKIYDSLNHSNRFLTIGKIKNIKKTICSDRQNTRTLGLFFLLFSTINSFHIIQDTRVIKLS